MTRAEVTAMLDRHRQAFASRSAAALAAGHAEDGTFESQAAGVVNGREKIRGVYEYWLEAFPDLDFTWGEPIIDGERVSLFWHFKGTLAGDFFGHSRPGAKVEFLGAGEYVLSPDGIVSAKHVFDFTGALISAGVLKVKPVD
jgi:predicted ester cyclase